MDTSSSSSGSLSRASSLNHLLTIKKKKPRQRSHTQTEVEEVAPQKKALSRQKSLSELVNRVKLSLKPLKQQPKRIPYSSQVDDYDRIRTIGAGASASVYSAKFKPTQSIVAIKVVDLEESNIEDSRLEALRKEIQIMALCRHPHLLEVFQSFVSLSQLYIITPIMTAGSCHDLLVKEFEMGLEEPIVACILKQVSLGLEYLHDNELIHRDIKSANMLVDYESGVVKLGDFGVSNQLLSNLAELPKNKACFRHHLSPRPLDLKKGRRSFVGTPCWMAPEILMNQDYDTKIDIWSLGITAVELASGKPPYSDYDPLTIFSMIIDDPVPTLNECAYIPSNAFKEFIESCLVKSPLHRYTIHHALNHSFLKKASGPGLLKAYLSRRPNLDRSTFYSYTKTKSAESSWDELEFMETTWDFDRPSLSLTSMHHEVNQVTDSPITPNDEELPFFKIDLVLSKLTEEH